MRNKGVTLFVVVVLTAATAVLVAAMAGLAMRSDTDLSRKKDEVQFDIFVSMLPIRARNDLSKAITDGGLRAVMVDTSSRHVQLGEAAVTYRYVLRDTFFKTMGTLDKDASAKAERELPEVVRDHRVTEAIPDDRVSQISDEWTRRRLKLTAEEFYGRQEETGYCLYFPRNAGGIDANTAPVEVFEILRGRLGAGLADALTTMRLSGVEITSQSLADAGLHPTSTTMSSLRFTTQCVSVVAEFRGKRMGKDFVVHLRLQGDGSFGYGGYEEIH